MRGSDLKFSELEEVPILNGNFTSRPIDTIKEDLFNPGTFLYTSVSALMQFTPGEPVSVLLGSTEYKRPFVFRNGPSDVARFTLIGDVLQYQEKKLLIADFLANCIREYDYETDNVTTFLGVCNQSTLQSRALLPEQRVSRFSQVMVAPFNLQHVKKFNYLLFADFGYKQLLKYNFSSETIELLDSSLYELLPNIYSFLVNGDGTKLYAAHSYGLSVVDLETKKVRLLVGERVNDRGDANPSFVAGSFKRASIGKLYTLKWIYDDEVIAATGRVEGVITFDLRRKMVSTYCIGKYSYDLKYIFVSLKA